MSSRLPVTRDDVDRAARTIAGRVHRTPTFTASSVSPGLVLKAELFQRTGSFKPRGVLNKLASLDAAERRAGVIAASAGNHAQALGWAAREEGISALVLSWRSASEAKMAAARAYGANLDQEAASPETVFERLEQLRTETGRTLVHPFDDPLVAAGQGTVGAEILEDAPEVETIVVPVGGGGLLAGIVAACEGRGIRVVGVEPESANALEQALAAGRSVPVTPRSVADGLNAPFAGWIPLAQCQAAGVTVVTVTEEEIREAMRALYTRSKLACEPAGAAGLAAVLAGKVQGDHIAVVVSGGNISAETASGILAGS
ncbi:MAG: pyridoxal-phosphate dependent enzyme [Gaiella sp.]